MANLVRFALSRGIRVAGYDRTPSPLTDRLQAEGAELVFEDDPALIPSGFDSPEDAMLVYTPAVPQSNRIFTELRARGFVPVKRAALLGMLTAPTKAICVAGSHGKTTTSSMIAHILYGSRIGCDAFLGGILRNYDSNLLLTPGAEYSVVEADEYDRSFLQLKPWTAIVTSTDPDHLDIYGDEAHYLEAFSDFTALIRPGGNLIVHTGLKFRPRTAQGVTTYTYSAKDDKADYHAENVRFLPGELIFDVVGPSLQVRDISLGVPLEINVDNAVAAAAASALAGATPDEIRQGLATFLGAKRRFEFWLKGNEPALSRPEDHCYIPAPPLHPHTRFRSRLRRSPLGGRRCGAHRDLSRTRAADRRSNLRPHLSGSEIARQGTDLQKRFARFAEKT